MFKRFKTYLFLVFILLSLWISGQDSLVVEQGMGDVQLVLKARVMDNAVLLRWGVNDREAWKYGNEYGYSIERATIFRDGKPLKESERIILTGNPIKPRPLPEWESQASENDMAAVAAQAIYGEDFITGDAKENPVINVINQSSELQQRFAFSMFAVDQDFEVAQLAGLGFIDKDVKSNERYLYNIKLAAPSELIDIKETGLSITPNNPIPLPVPFDFAGYYYNDAFVLIWEYDALRDFYNSYDLEKSEDGINFTKVNKVPITKLAETEVSGISYTDSIPTYEKKYWYRIKGKTIFNEDSTPSDTISVIAYKKLLVAPEFKDNEIISDKEAVLKWDFATDEAWKVTGFDILRAEKAPGPYSEIQTDLDAEQRSFRYTALSDINYFKVRARGIAGDYQDSSPNMIQPIDSIPPSIPIGLSGTIDTLGIVQLSWTPNVELDLRGYSVLKANRPNQEFTRLNKQEFRQTAYSDTVNLKSFNEKVYYKIVALDNRYNESIPSDVLELVRPDMIPPTNAIFTNYEIQEKGISLSWQNSASADVVKHILYRKKISTTEQIDWENIYEIDDLNINEFIDEKVSPENKYVYTIVAIDANGLESDPSPPISASTLPNLIKPEIKGLYANVNRELGEIRLSWRYKEPNVHEIQIFKMEKGKEYGLLTTLPPNRKQYLDQRLSPNTIYRYGIRAVFTDGTVSEWSEIEVTY